MMSFDNDAKEWDTESRIDRAKVIAEAMGQKLFIREKK